MSDATDNTSGAVHQHASAGSSRQEATGNSRSATADAVAADRNENCSRFIIVSPLKGAENYEEWEISLDLHIQSLGSRLGRYFDGGYSYHSGKREAAGGCHIGDMAEPYCAYSAKSDVIGMELKDVTRENYDAHQKRMRL
ncbi:hypothetical protein E4U60_004567 [Claviceps pazoutovae]|uniref:Uncharacterized protein n=1 Tax=Claviceps pazoutovae TaxID=1649127 RepID=A0A9P7M8P5_9HYPO|nr:hypothetical protein E4U60_004567 [Claviceps pazoutovae]